MGYITINRDNSMPAWVIFYRLTLKAVITSPVLKFVTYPYQ